MKILKAGMRLKSAVCDTELMIIRAPVGPEVEICCGGTAMLAAHENGTGTLDPDFSQGTLIGKRYVDKLESFELLCTKGGKGGVTISGELLEVKIAKALPTSD